MIFMLVSRASSRDWWLIEWVAGDFLASWSSLPPSSPDRLDRAIASLRLSAGQGRGRFRQCTGQLARVWPGGGWAWTRVAEGLARPGGIRAGHRERAVVLGAAARVASITTCSLSWPAAVSCACTSRSWRRRSRWPGLAPGRQSGQVNAGAAVRYRVARIGGPPSGLPRTWLGGRGAASLRCLCGWGAIAGWGAMDG
jgi:hypothetical protein